MKLPKLIGRIGVCELVGIDVKNISHQRKTKGFPQPIVIIDKFPVWLESDIVTWVEWRNKFKGAAKND